MLNKAHILQKLHQVSDKKLGVRAFREWLEGASENMHADGSAEDAIELVSSIDWLFSEADDANLSDKRLLEELEAIAPRYSVPAIEVSYANPFRLVYFPSPARFEEWCVAV